VDRENAEEQGAADFHFERALQLEESGDYDNALAECDQAVQAGRQFLAQVHNLRAIVLEQLGLGEEAAAVYKKALVLDPALHEAADNLRELESELGQSHELVTIARYSHPAQAHVARAKLESEGVFAFVADEGLVAANWLYANAAGGVKLQVSEGNAERALAALGIHLETEEAGEAEGKDQQELRCPRCGSVSVRYETYHLGRAFASRLLLPGPLPFLKRRWSCRDCGYEWKKLGTEP